uniref:response regulator n=1 Tax=Trichocoleus desertorum TaxID=1481672 RepID=UPI0025B628F1|nr:hybrid sensor histidine kinase/response regulator [Trichocoleus desertorum]
MTDLSKLKILLVEDSPVSQRLVSRQLKSLGCEPDVAANGQEALALLAQTHYTVVLLDCQMPILDGYATAQAIRNLEGQNRQAIVIAMTANDCEGEQEKCLNAGMNDFLNKPFSEPELIEKLKRWSLALGSEVGTEEAWESAPSETEPAAEITGVVTPELATRVGLDLDRFQRITRGNSVFQQQVLQLFLQDTRKNITLVKTALQTQDLKTLEHKAHQIKGASANVGIKVVQTLAERMEQQIQQRSWEEITVGIAQIEQALNDIDSFIAA